MNSPAKPTPAGLLLPVLTAGFATAAAMWIVGYVTHLPGLTVPPVVTGVLLIAAHLAGGAYAGRRVLTGRSLGTGAAAGLATGLINLLVLGALVTEQDGENGALAQNAALIGLGYLGFSAVAGGLGALFTMRIQPEDPSRTATIRTWTARFAFVAALTALPVLLSGGIVTSTEAGLAVPDWPTSFQANMFLYPISKMTGGIYYEHAHRLFGSLVGLTVLVFTLTVAFLERRPARNLLAIAILGGVSIASFFVTGMAHNILLPAGFGIALFIAYRFGSWRFGVALTALAIVIIQGILGGIRVEATSTALAFVHGIFGQLTFALLCVMSAMFSERFDLQGSTARPSDGVMRAFASTALVLVILQLVLGAGARHFAQHPAFMHPHIALAVILLIVGPLAGFRARSKHRELKPVRLSGTSLIHAIVLQFALGWATFFVVMSNKTGDPPPEVILATAHQGIGALILASASLLFVWTRRLIPSRRKNTAEAQKAPAG